MPNIPGLMNGNDWQYNKCDGSWEILSVLPISEFTDIVMETYDETFTNDNLKVCKCTAQMEEPSGIMSTTIQNDTRANANITSDFSLLEHLQWVKPVKCNSANNRKIQDPWHTPSNQYVLLSRCQWDYSFTDRGSLTKLRTIC